jgi:hypothetical protein
MIFPGFASILAMLSTLPGWFDYGQPSGVLWNDHLFVAINPTASLARDGALYRGTFAPLRRGVRVPVEHLNPTYSLTLDKVSSQAKLGLRDDRLLLFQGGVGYFIFPLTEVPLLESSDFGERLIEVRGYRSKRAFVESFSAHTYELMFPNHRKHDVPMQKPPGLDDFSDVAYITTARYSLQIDGPKSVRLFHAYKDKLFISVEPDYLENWYLDEKGFVREDLPKPPDRELRTGKLPADFTERFTVYTSPERDSFTQRDYLVTVNGKVYMAVPKGKAEVEVSAVWNDPKRKIVGVVQDQANDAVYGWGFVTTSATPERFYVKLGPKPVGGPYERTVPLWGDRSDAYLESYECASAFRTAKK